MLVEAIGRPLTYRWPAGEIRLEPGKPVALPDERARKLLEKAPGKVRLVALPPGDIEDTATDPHQSVFAVKIAGSLIGDYWLCLSYTEPFEPGDGLPVYRPSEIRALAGKGYGPDALQAVHRLKTAFDGTVVR